MNTHLWILNLFLGLPSMWAIKLTPIVETNFGPIQGKTMFLRGLKVHYFLGIPYAEPPIGNLRFRKPVKPKPWKEVRNVTDYGPPCIQRKSDYIEGQLTGSEDCLHLNVYVTQATFHANRFNPKPMKTPVMVWIHGQSCLQDDLEDSGSNQAYQPDPFVNLKNVILVTVNYRLGRFGFMYLGRSEARIPGNMGLWDQNLALQWVQENIQRFGGDPKSVTIFGQGFGSLSISGHIISPHSIGLFNRAVMQSGSLLVPGQQNPNYNVRQNSFQVFNRTGCWRSGASKDLLKCLQRYKAETLLSINLNQQSRDVSDVVFEPFRMIFGDEYLPRTPDVAFAKGLYNGDIDLLVGVERDELAWKLHEIDPEIFNFNQPKELASDTAVKLLSRIFVDQSLDYFSQIYLGHRQNRSQGESEYLRRQVIRAFSDYFTICPTYVFTDYFSRNRDDTGRVYGYYHTQRIAREDSLNASWLGVPSGSEIPFVFGDPLKAERMYSNQDISLSQKMVKFWTDFAAHGRFFERKKKWFTFQEARKNGTEPSARVLNFENLDSQETERIKFCIDQWPRFVQYSKASY